MRTGAVHAAAGCLAKLDDDFGVSKHLSLNAYANRFARQLNIEPAHFDQLEGDEAFRQYYGLVGRELNRRGIGPLTLLRHDLGKDARAAHYLTDLETRLIRVGIRVDWSEKDLFESSRDENQIHVGAFRYAHAQPFAAVVQHIEHELAHEPPQVQLRDRAESMEAFVRRHFERLITDEIRVRLADRTTLRRMREAGLNAPDDIVFASTRELWAAADRGASDVEIRRLVINDYAHDLHQTLPLKWAAQYIEADAKELEHALTMSRDVEWPVTTATVLSSSLWMRSLGDHERLVYLDKLQERIQGSGELDLRTARRFAFLRLHLERTPRAFD